MAYGVQDWTDPKVAIELGKPETERRRVEDIQARRRPNGEAGDHVIDSTRKGQDDGTLREAGVGQEQEKTVSWVLRT